MFNTNDDYLKAKWSQTFQFETEGFEMDEETLIDEDELKEELLSTTNDISFPVVKVFGETVFILYFVQCSNILVKSFLQYKLYYYIHGGIIPTNYTLILKQAGHNF